MKRDLGVPEEIAGQCLNHAPTSVTGRHYAAEHDMTSKRRAFESWNRHLRQLIEGQDEGNIVKFTG